jgi:hypothetical protein
MLGWFASGWFGSSPFLVYPLVAIAIFMTVFCAVSLRALTLKRSDVQRCAHMPLEDDHG